MALITSDCVPLSQEHVAKGCGEGVGVGVGGGGVMACASHLLRVDKQKVAGGVLLAAARNHLFVRKAVNTPSISLQLQ